MVWFLLRQGDNQMNPKLWRDDSPLMQFHYEKGGSAPMPPQPSPMEEANAQMMLESKKAAIQEKKDKAEAKAAAIALENKKQAFNQNLSAAQQKALGFGSSKLSQLGLDDHYG